MTPTEGGTPAFCAECQAPGHYQTAHTERCTCSDPHPLAIHNARHRAGDPYRCVRCGDQAVVGGLCVVHEKRWWK